MVPPLKATASQGFCRFGKEAWSGEVRALVLRAVGSWAPGGASPIPPHWSLSGVRLEIPDNSQNQRWGLEVTQQLLADFGGRNAAPKESF